jgi:DNA-directed RNA polymerase sigma subunit (sigma70/sigma32)
MSDMRNRPLSIEEAINYRKSGDFKKHLREKMDHVRDNFVIPAELPSQRKRWLLRAINRLDERKGFKNKIYKRTLELRVYGATHEQIAQAIKEPVKKVKDIEKNAIKAVMDACDSKILLPEGYNA